MGFLPSFRTNEEPSGSPPSTTAPSSGRCAAHVCVCVGLKGLSLYYHRGAILSRSEKLVQNTSWPHRTGAAFGFVFILETNLPEIHLKRFSFIQQCMDLHKCRKCLSFKDTKSTTVCLLDWANQFLCGSGLKYVVPQPYWLKHVLVNTFKIIDLFLLLSGKNVFGV